jgi:hypothetical protein
VTLRRTILLAASAIAATLVLQASAAGYVEPESVRPISWSLGSIEGPRRLTIGISTGYCVGKPKPRVDRIEREWHRRSLVLTVFIRYPEVHWGKHEGCGGVGLGMSMAVGLGRPLSHRAIYDGSSSPPKRRYPGR